MLISEEYVKINTILHKRHPTYGMTGHRWVNKVLRVVSDYKCATLLDYGCGKGTLKLALRVVAPDLVVSEYDPCVRGKAGLPESSDLIVCTDVFEHIEPVNLDDVLDHIWGLTGKVIFATVATRPAKKLLCDGRNAHLIVENQSWWLSEIEKRWIIDEVAKDVSQPGEFYFVGIPRGDV